MPGASNISKFLDGNSLRAIKTYVDGKSGSIPNEFIDSAFMGGPSIDHTEDFATLYPIPDTLSDTDGTHRVLFSETQLREVAGNSIAYNQRNANSSSSETKNGITFAKNSDGSWSVSGTATADTFKSLMGGIALYNGHKYLVKGSPNGSSAETYGLVDAWSGIGGVVDQNGKIITLTSDKTYQPAILVKNGVSISTPILFTPQLFDLTLMGLDSVSTVEEAKSELLKRGIDIDQYNPYSEGEIRNTTASGVKVRNYNLLNINRTQGTLNGADYTKGNKQNFEEGKYYNGLANNDYVLKNSVTDIKWEGTQITFTNSVSSYGLGFPARVIPGQSYSLEITPVLNPTNGYRTVSWYDENGYFIKYDERTQTQQNPFIAPERAYWGVVLLFGSANNATSSYKDICFHLSTLRTGYAPYKEAKAISFASTELLSAGEAHDTIEVVEGDKVAGIQRYNLVHVKRVGTVDLGTLNWISYTGISDKYIYQAPLNDMKLNAGLTCSKLVQVKAVYASGDDYSISSHPTLTKVYARTSNYEETETAFKTAMNGVILNYELATPTRTTIAENLTFEEVSATIEQGGSIETVYETLAPNCTTGFAVDKDVIIQEDRYLDENGLYTLVSNISNRYALKSSLGGTITDTYINSLF